MQFPMYWFSVPAIMKGWLDRVLAQGFAFSLEKMYDNGIFKVCLIQHCQNTVIYIYIKYGQSDVSVFVCLLFYMMVYHFPEG